MSRYDKLNSAFTTQVKENNAFIAQNLNFAQQIVSALTAFLELPAENPGLEDVEKYLQYLHLDREKGYLAKQELAAAVSHFPEGKFQFGVGILLAAKHENNPRQLATFAIQGDRDAELLKIEVFGKTFEFESITPDDLDLTAFCAHVYDELMNGLAWRISDEVEKTRVGFDVTPLDD